MTATHDWARDDEYSLPVTDDLAVVRAMLPGANAELVETLHDGERARVHRMRLGQPGRPERTVIVKRFKEREGWAREVAGLKSARGPVAAILAESVTPFAVVCEDVGNGPSVADALLGDRPEVARDAVIGWATATARLHLESLPQRDAFRHALNARAEGLPVDRTSSEIARVAAVLGERCAAIDVVAPPAAIDELRVLCERLGGETNAALSPGDACPDNNIRREGEVILVDFEDAQWRHVAWDVAYLTVPWPSCWCSWRLPADLVTAAVDRYRALVSAELPYAATTEFDRDVQAATVGWAFVSIARSLPSALTDDPPHRDPRVITPTRRARLLHRLAIAADRAELPALSALARRLREALVDRWGEIPLAYAPAFKPVNRVDPAHRRAGS